MDQYEAGVVYRIPCAGRRCTWALSLQVADVKGLQQSSLSTSQGMLQTSGVRALLLVAPCALVRVPHLSCQICI